MNIRQAHKTDKAQLQALMDELNAYRKEIFSQGTQKFHERTSPYPPIEDRDFDDTLIFAAFDDSEKIVGFIQGSIHERKNHALSRLGCIDELYVREEARGKGVAQNLLSELESEFKKRGCDHITTHTDIENELSQQFYLKSGMKKTTVEFWKELK